MHTGFALGLDVEFARTITENVYVLSEKGRGNSQLALVLLRIPFCLVAFLAVRVPARNKIGALIILCVCMAHKISHQQLRWT